MPFFEYRQYNTGGSFYHNAAEGISVHVIIEADSPSAANVKAESIGLYFDGIDRGYDCACCGDRWYQAWTGDESDEPTIYGTPVAEYEPITYWIGNGQPNGFIHYADGRVEPILHSPKGA